jgi:hypothetical protein
VPDDVGRAIQFGNYTISLQDYWNEDISTLSENECSYYPGTKGQGVSLVIGCTQDDENSLSLDFLHDNQDEIISALEESNDLEVKKYEDITSNGDVTGIFYQAELNDIEGNGYMFTFPSENENMLYVIVLIESDKSKKDFSDDFLEIIKSIKKAPTSY